MLFDHWNRSWRRHQLSVLHTVIVCYFWWRVNLAATMTSQNTNTSLCVHYDMRLQGEASWAIIRLDQQELPAFLTVRWESTTVISMETLLMVSFWGHRETSIYKRKKPSSTKKVSFEFLQVLAWQAIIYVEYAQRWSFLLESSRLLFESTSSYSVAVNILLMFVTYSIHETPKDISTDTFHSYNYCFKLCSFFRMISTLKIWKTFISCTDSVVFEPEKDELNTVISIWPSQ